jgi:hypothetical protein
MLVSYAKKLQEKNSIGFKHKKAQKNTFNSYCDIANPCDDTLGLSCRSQFCQCNSTQFFDNSRCRNYITVNNPCSSLLQCDPFRGFTCLSNSTCGCTEGQFFNGSYCGKIRICLNLCLIPSSYTNLNSWSCKIQLYTSVWIKYAMQRKSRFVMPERLLFL